MIDVSEIRPIGSENQFFGERIDFVRNTDINQLIIFRFMTVRKYNQDSYLNWVMSKKILILRII